MVRDLHCRMECAEPTVFCLNGKQFCTIPQAYLNALVCRRKWWVGGNLLQIFALLKSGFSKAAETRTKNFSLTFHFPFIMKGKLFLLRLSKFQVLEKRRHFFSWCVEEWRSWGSHREWLKLSAGHCTTFIKRKFSNYSSWGTITSWQK